MHYWYFGDGTTSGVINPSHTYSNSGTYQVSLVVHNAPYCKKDSISTTVVVNVATGLYDNKPEAVRVFPNPCSEVLNIDMGKFENVKIQITNISGQLIYETENAFTIPVSGFPKGFYYLDISGSFGLYHSCFIKNE